MICLISIGIAVADLILDFSGNKVVGITLLVCTGLLTIGLFWFVLFYRKRAIPNGIALV